MAGISKKKISKNGKTVIKYTITYRDIFGKQHTSGIYDTIKEAKKHLEEFESIKNVITNNISFGKILDIFMEKVTRKYAKNTIKAYHSYINNYLFVLSEIKYNKLNPLLLQDFFDKIEKQRPYTAHNVLIFCKGAVNYAILKKLIPDSNIFEDVDKIKRPARNLNHLEFNQIVSILNICKKIYPEFYTMLFLLLGSGARIGEVIALEKKDFIGNSIIINKQYTAGELKNKPKTDKSVRTIYLFPTLTKILQEHLLKLPSDCDLMFPNRNKNYINPNNFRKRFWQPLLKHCGINYRIRLHDIRGSYTDLLLSNGISGKFAQNQLGHENSSTTFNIYAQNNFDSINAALNILEEKFKKCELNVSTKEIKRESNIIFLNTRKAEKLE